MPRLRETHKAKIYGCLVGCGLLIPLLSACTPPEVQLPPVPMEQQASSQDYLIGAEDIIEVMVWKNPDLSRTVNVRPDGKISLPLIGDLQAAGLTAVQLTASVVEHLKGYYKEPPEVSVIVQQVNSYAVYILGEVRSPGRYVVKSGTTFLQAVTLAGGFTEFASTNRIMVRRMGHEDGQETAMGIRYKDVISGKQSNVLLKPGDTVIIP
jgi:polysaccharide export outer membrane protein